MRAVLDTGAQDTFITISALEGGNWKSAKTKVSIGNFSQNPETGTNMNKRFQIEVQGLHNTTTLTIYPLGVEHMAGIIYQPPVPLSLQNKICKFNPLADPEAFSIAPSTLEFQLIIGNDMVNAIYGSIVHRFTSTFVIKNSIFGNIFSGPIPDNNGIRKTCLSIFTLQGKQATECVQVLSTEHDHHFEN